MPTLPLPPAIVTGKYAYGLWVERGRGEEYKYLFGARIPQLSLYGEYGFDSHGTRVCLTCRLRKFKHRGAETLWSYCRSSGTVAVLLCYLRPSPSVRPFMVMSRWQLPSELFLTRVREREEERGRMNINTLQDSTPDFERLRRTRTYQCPSPWHCSLRRKEE